MELVEANPQAGLAVYLGLIRAGPQRLHHFRFGQLKGEGVTLGVGEHLDDRSVGGRERLGPYQSTSISGPFTHRAPWASGLYLVQGVSSSDSRPV